MFPKQWDIVCPPIPVVQITIVWTLRCGDSSEYYDVFFRQKVHDCELYDIIDQVVIVTLISMVNIMTGHCDGEGGYSNKELIICCYSTAGYIQNWEKSTII